MIADSFVKEIDLSSIWKEKGSLRGCSLGEEFSN